MTDKPFRAGQPIFGRVLTPDAEKFNAPVHFGKNAAATASGDEPVILPVEKPTLRRAKARNHGDRTK